MSITTETQPFDIMDVVNRAQNLENVQQAMMEAEAALDQARNILFAMPDTKGMLDQARHEMFDMSLKIKQMRKAIEKV